MRPVWKSRVQVPPGHRSSSVKTMRPLIFDFRILFSARRYSFWNVSSLQSNRATVAIKARRPTYYIYFTAVGDDHWVVGIPPGPATYNGSDGADPDTGTWVNTDPLLPSATISAYVAP